MDMQEVNKNMFIQHPGLPVILFTGSEGVYLYDSTGRRVIDATGGPMVVSIGHGRKEVAEAAAESIGKVSYILPVFASEARIELTKKIKSRLPRELNRIYYCSGGSEANEAAIKFARQYHVVAGNSSKYKVISRKRAYHGNTFATVSLGSIEERRRDFTPLLWNHPRVEACYCYRCPFGKEYPGCDIDCALDLEKRVLEEGPETIAAFIAEPIVASASGVNVPPPEYYPLIRKICDNYGVLFIVDEVVTGFGRTGRNMAMDHFGVIPDISVFAKGVSSGYVPLAGMAVRESLVKLFEQKGVDFQSLYSFSAHPLACAIGNKVQEIIDREDLIARADRMGKYLMEKLSLLKELPLVGDVRGKGMLCAVELVKDRKTKEPFPAEAGLKMKIIIECAINGVMFYPGYYQDDQGRGDHIMISPPFIITEEQIEECVGVLQAAIDKYQEEIT